MSYHGLLEYIRSAKDFGASDQEISERLHKAGWYRVDIQDGFELYGKITQIPKAHTPQPVPTPTLTERVVPRSADSNILLVAVVSFVAGFIGYLLLV